jgi:hypothetical protein
MYSVFRVKKQSGTYSETLEAFGLMNLLNEILSRDKEASFRNVNMVDKGLYYEINSQPEITQEMVEKLSYFPAFPFIITSKSPLPNGVSVYFDYPSQKLLRDARKKEYEELNKSQGEVKRQKQKGLEEKYNSEGSQKIDEEYDVYSQLISPNQYSGFKKLFDNFYGNQDYFKDTIYDILNYYLEDDSKAIIPGKIKEDFRKELEKIENEEVRKRKLNEVQSKYHFDEEVTALQLYNPIQGKGLNKSKANGITSKNIPSYWISEAMKISGSLNNMLCKPVKVGRSYDLKIFVPEFIKIENEAKNKIVTSFKKTIKGSSPVKIDIINILTLVKKFIENSPEYKGRVRNSLSGLHSVYQKDLGQNKAVVNIAFIQIPYFIEINNKEQADNWVEILEEQIIIINGIEELGESIQGLQNYRNFFSGSDLESYFKFSYWYGGYLSKSLTNKKYYIKPFKTETLTKFYIEMEPNLKEIIENKGFQAVAYAIRYSTVKIQYNKDFWETQLGYKIRYGLAQELQNKSKSKDDLISFIGDFIGTYNYETARVKEKKKSPGRENIRADELNEFFILLNNNSSRLIGAMLSSYGFALPEKDEIKKNNTNAQDINIENE